MLESRKRAEGLRADVVVTSWACLGSVRGWLACWRWLGGAGLTSIGPRNLRACLVFFSRRVLVFSFQTFTNSTERLSFMSRRGLMRPRHESACQKRHYNADPASKITYAKQEVALSRIKVTVQHACGLPILQAFKRAIWSTYPTVSSFSPFPPPCIMMINLQTLLPSQNDNEVQNISSSTG